MAKYKAVPLEELYETYLRLGSVWKTADFYNLCGQTVHKRLTKNGLKIFSNAYTEEEKEFIKNWYAEREGKPVELKKLAKILGRKYHTNVSRFARQNGLTCATREKSEKDKRAISKRQALHIRENGHPKGMLGKKHSLKVKKILQVKSAEMWANFSKEKKADISMKAIKTREKNGNLIPPRKGASWKQGWATISENKRYYFRSAWEVNYAFYLEWLKGKGEILEWEHEPETFWFEKIKRGTRSYTPDFRIEEKNGNIVYHEVKGWMDDRSKTKIKRMAKYHPNIKLVIVDSKTYRALAKQVKALIPAWGNWEYEPKQ